MKPSRLPQPVLSVPLGVDPKSYYHGLLGPLSLGLSLGLQLTVTALLLLGPSKKPGFADQLTEYGKTIFRPEHDLSIYVAGAALTLAAGLMAMWYWRAKLGGLESTERAKAMTSSALFQGVLAATSLLTFLSLISSCWFSSDYPSAPSAARPLPGLSEGFSMLWPGAVALLCAILDLECGWSYSTAPASRWELWHRRMDKLLPYTVPLLILLVVGVPPGSWSYLAGRFFMIDVCHHLNFFMMGPALSFSHGKAFGTEIYSQYGIGWPLLASTLSHFWALTYTNFVGLEIVYGCVYYLALFFLLRTCFQEEIWAAFGLVLAIYWQVFSGLQLSEIIWLFPSSSPMRHPMDVWFFLALVMHQRSGRMFWTVAAGVAGGLGVLFETETGVYLLVTFLVYSVFQAGMAAGKGRAGGAKRWLLPFLAFYSAVAATLLPMLFYASRGTLFTGGFWHGWVEALVAYAGQGAGALPLAGLPDTPMVFFIIMITTYLAIIAGAAVRGLHGSASQSEVLLATLAAYGLALLLVFVNRSHPFNLCHAAIPFAVVLTVLMARCHKVLASRLRWSALPYAMAAGLIPLLLAKPEFQRYPSLLASVFTEAPTGGISLRSAPTDISGLPPGAEGFVREFSAITSTIRRLASDGQTVAILDPNDTLLYSAADAGPWSRYASLFYMALTQQSLEGIRNDLLIRSPRYVVIRGQKAMRQPDWEFVWAPLYQAVTNRYDLRQTIGSYDVWQRSDHP